MSTTSSLSCKSCHSKRLNIVNRSLLSSLNVMRFPLYSTESGHTERESCQVAKITAKERNESLKPAIALSRYLSDGHESQPIPTENFEIAMNELRFFGIAQQRQSKLSRFKRPLRCLVRMLFVSAVDHEAMNWTQRKPIRREQPLLRSAMLVFFRY